MSMPDDVDASGASPNKPGTGDNVVGSNLRDAQLYSMRDVQIIALDPAFEIVDEFFSEGEAETQPAPPPGAAVPTGTSDALAPVFAPEPVQEENRTPGALASSHFPISELSPDSLPDDAVLSISDLLEEGIEVEWQEAVAITRRICDVISRHPSAGTPEYLLDPRQIEITESGAVHVLPGEPGGDPFVKQVGRILRALLQNGRAPAPLRLLASQATFELSGFMTLEEFSKVLCEFDAPQGTDPIRTAFTRGREARLPRPSAVAQPAPTLQPPAPEPLSQETSDGYIRRWPTNWNKKIAAASVALVFLGVVTLGMIRRHLVSNVAPPTEVAQSGTGSQAETAADPPPLSRSQVTEMENAASQELDDQGGSATKAVAPTRAQPTIAREAPAVLTEPVVVNPAVAPSITTAVATSTELGDDARQRKFDALILADPLYQLDSGQKTPENLVSLRESKRLLLPSIAGRDYDRARRALDAGDFERALLDAGQAMRLLEEPDIGPVPSDLREALLQLIREAREVRASEEQRVYAAGDPDVVPPLPIGRQLPAMAPAGISPDLVGQLELLIGADGAVEVVRLHTSLNRYHERMIVSAAKAWRYKPATKSGRAVRFRLFQSVNLPED
jgi:hypothetical protein